MSPQPLHDRLTKSDWIRHGSATTDDPDAKTKQRKRFSVLAPFIFESLCMVRRSAIA
jgi:hypothetical protein